MTERCEVAVVGGGPVGLAMALQLGRLGVKTTLIERRSTFTRHPKATGVHAKTMEIFRQWGIAPTIRARGGPLPGVDECHLGYTSARLAPRHH